MEFGHRAAVGDVPLVEGDVGDPKAVAEAVERYGIDAVIHFAAYKSPGESMLEPQRYFGNNAAKQRLAHRDAARGRGGADRLLLDLCRLRDARAGAGGGGRPVHPESPYGESKAMSERVHGWYDRCLGLRSVSLRHFNAAGAWPDGSIGEDRTVTINLIPLLMKAALGRRGPLEVFGTDYPTPDGTAIRDYVHVLDLAEAHVRALEYLEGGGETTVLNLGTGVGSSVFEVLGAAERVIGRPVPHAAGRPPSRGSRGALRRHGALEGGLGLDGAAQPRRDPGVGVGVALDPPRRVRRLRSAGASGDRRQ